jgi:multisubunit Na+/H+ antiporter MnhE subunit
VISAVALPSDPVATAAARRAAAVLAFATTPGTVVLDSDPDEGTVLMHRVRPRPGRLATVVQR